MKELKKFQNQNSFSFTANDSLEAVCNFGDNVSKVL